MDLVVIPAESGERFVAPVDRLIIVIRADGERAFRKCGNIHSLGADKSAWLRRGGLVGSVALRFHELSASSVRRMSV